MFELLVALLAVILILWIISVLLPALGLPPQVQTILYVIVVFVVILWLLEQLSPAIFHTAVILNGRVA